MKRHGGEYGEQTDDKSHHGHPLEKSRTLLPQAFVPFKEELAAQRLELMRRGDPWREVPPKRERRPGRPGPAWSL
jgi:hypothetical protein